MLSRAADAMYWMCRYIERAENVARFIEVNCYLMLDLPVNPLRQWESLILTSGDEKEFAKHFNTSTQDTVIEFLAFSTENPNSIISCLNRARDNARSIREIISSEMWEQLNKFYLMVKNIPKRDAREAPQHYFTEINMASHMFTGVMHATMSHGEAWHFGNLGMNLERADKTSRILDVRYFMLAPHMATAPNPYSDIEWAALLKSASALEMYRKRFGLIAPESVAKFLILDREFPRSIRSCLLQTEDSLRRITGSAVGAVQNTAEQRLGRLCADIDYTPIEDILSNGLHGFLDKIQIQLNQIDNAIYETFFAPRPVA